MDAELWQSIKAQNGFNKYSSEENSPPLGKFPRAHLIKNKGMPPNIVTISSDMRLGSSVKSSNVPCEFYSHQVWHSRYKFPRLQIMNWLENLNKFLRKAFRKLGYTIATNTGYFFLIPIMSAIICATGIQRLQYKTDPEYLFSPTNGPAKDERQLIEQNFKMNFSSNFDPSRITRPGKFVRFIASAKDGGTIIRENLWDEIMKLDEYVTNVKINFQDEVYTYDKLCAIWNGQCYGNKILEMNEFMPDILNGSVYITYPATVNPYRFSSIFVSVFFGGVTIEKDETVSDVKAVVLTYWLKNNTANDDKRSDIWEEKIIASDFNQMYKYIKVAKYGSKTLEDELDVNTKSVIPYLFVTVFIMIIFSVLSLSMADWVRSKALMGIIGILSVCIASVMTFGIMLYANVPFIGMNLAAPFLMLGIGIDDMFVMLAAWRRTRIQDSVEERLGEAYAEAGVAITITSLTDTLSFFIGIITPFPSVQIFCLYTGTALLLTYFWQLTFFGACMAVAGRLEKRQKHALCCCIAVKAKSESVGDNCYSLCCAGGINQNDAWNPVDNRPHVMMVFFRDVFARCVNNSYVKGLIILIFMLYLGGAIYGILEVKEGLERRRLSRYDSYSVDFFDMEDKYFRDYPYRIQVVIHGDVRYSDPQTRHHLLTLHERLENMPYVGERYYTESWIRGWYDFLYYNTQYIKNFNNSDEENFIKNLREYYLQGEDNIFKLDVNFNENFTRILASRFIIQTYKIRDSNEDKELMKNLREFAGEFPLNVTFYHPLFIFFDQYVLVRSVSIKTICIAAGVMLIVSLILIPNPWCSLWVGFSILSIEVGVVGYMTLWGVNLDSISMINLIMCIGFSVDFSAHISYAYFAANAVSPKDRVKDSLYTLGYPILQGAVSTILGVLALVLAPSYIFLTFCKTVFLVVFFGAMHGLLLLPVLLSLFGPDNCEGNWQLRGNINECRDLPASQFQRNYPSISDLHEVDSTPNTATSLDENEIEIDSADIETNTIESSSIESITKQADELIVQKRKSRTTSQERDTNHQTYYNYGFEIDEPVTQNR